MGLTGFLNRARRWRRRRALKVRLSAPVLVLLSDDWGADHIGCDGRETPDDVARLAGVLAARFDAAGHPAVLSPNMVAMRPDFARIRADGLERYRAVDAYAGRDDLLAAWRRGVDASVFCPGFHGRDHFNVALWMDELRAGQPEFMAAFRQDRVLYKGPHWARLVAERPCREFLCREFIDCRRRPSVPISAEEQSERVRQGVEAHARQFGRPPRSAVAPGGAFDDGTELAWAAAGIDYFEAPGFHRHRLRADGEFARAARHYGEPSAHGLGVIVGNVAYEPRLHGGGPGAAEAASGAAMRAALAAAARREPVVCQTHAQNYYGGQAAASAHLDGLASLLEGLVARLPRMLFAGMHELGDLIYGRRRAPERLRQVRVGRGMTPRVFLREVGHSIAVACRS